MALLRKLSNPKKRGWWLGLIALIAVAAYQPISEEAMTNRPLHF